MRFTQKPPLGSLINWSHPLSRGLMGCWLMNEGSGNRISDLSGNGNHGILMNGPLWVPGKVGQALSFNGVDDSVNLGNHPSLNLPNAFTIAVWVNQTSLVNWSGIISKSNINYLLLIGQPGTPYLVAQVGGIEKNTGSGTETILPNNEWHFLVGTFDGTYLRYYYDGVREGLETATGGNVDTTTADAYISDWDYSNKFNGLIDGVRIYNRALSAKEIRWLYAQPYAMFERRPVWMDYVAAAGGLSIPVAMDHYRQRRN
jgi:hypothetical protein